MQDLNFSKNHATINGLVVVVSNFNPSITQNLAQGALECWQRVQQQAYQKLQQRGHGFEPKPPLSKLPPCLQHEPLCFKVPGAFEIPFMAQKAFAQGALGVVALGAVIKGETDHYQYICQAVSHGLIQVQLQAQRPLGFGLLTTQNAELAMARAGGAKGNKGAEAMQAVLDLLF